MTYTPAPHGPRVFLIHSPFGSVADPAGLLPVQELDPHTGTVIKNYSGFEELKNYIAWVEEVVNE